MMMMFGKNCQKELLFRFLQQRTVVFEDARKKEKRVVVVFLFSLSLSRSTTPIMAVRFFVSFVFRVCDFDEHKENTRLY